MDFSFSFKHARALLSCSPKGRLMRAENSVTWLQALTLSSRWDQSIGLQLPRVGVPKTWAGLLLGLRDSGKVGGAAPATPSLAAATALAQSWRHVWGLHSLAWAAQAALRFPAASSSCVLHSSAIWASASVGNWTRHQRGGIKPNLKPISSRVGVQVSEALTPTPSLHGKCTVTPPPRLPLPLV